MTQPYSNIEMARAALTLEQRDALIRLARQHQIPVRTIATVLGMSTARVYQISGKVDAQ